MLSQRQIFKTYNNREFAVLKIHSDLVTDFTFWNTKIIPGVALVVHESNEVIIRDVDQLKGGKKCLKLE